MTETQQREALQRQIWKMANDVRNKIDGWDFKQYVLGTLFYRFISEKFENRINCNGGDYASMNDDEIEADAKADYIQQIGYFIYPSELFQNVTKTSHTNDNLNTDLARIFKSIESSANGYSSEDKIKGLFDSFDINSSNLGTTVKEKNKCLSSVLKGVAEIEFGNFDDTKIDLFGDAYEFLISNYAANAGKSGGEYFTPQNVSKLIVKLAMHNQTEVNKIYDPTCGSGSLLLQAKKYFDKSIIQYGFFGQEATHTTYNLARMNMILHNINHAKFNIKQGDTLLDPHFKSDKPFDVIVANPPYSTKWQGSDNPTLINDDRFAPASVLAPKSKADFAFVLHGLSYLSEKGRAVIICFPGIFYRNGAEQKIRKYLIDNNFVESVIGLAPNLFFGTSISVSVLVLAKNKKDTKVQFIDASDLFKKEKNNNVMTDDHIDQIVDLFDKKQNVAHKAESVDYEKIKENDYNLSISSYVTPKENLEVIDIVELNANIKETALKIDKLRKEIDAIIKEIK